MSNYTGVLPTIYNYSGISPIFKYVEYTQDLFNAGAVDNYIYAQAGIHTKIIVNKLVKNINGISSSSYSNIFYNNIWYLPHTLTLNLVTQDLSFTIYVFNGYLNTINLNSITNTAPQCDLVLPDLPQTFNALQEYSYPLLIHMAGDPDINGNIIFDFIDYTLNITVTGDRVTQFDFFPIKKLSIKHSRINNTFGSLYQQQSRIRLNDNEYRTVSMQLERENMDFDSLFGYAQDKLTSIPIPVEAMYPADTGSLTGLSTLSISNDIDNFFELPLCNYILIDDREKVELIKVSSIDYTNKIIVLDTAITKDFDASNTTYYPAMLAWITSYNNSQKEKNLHTFEFEFKEASLGG